MWQQAVAAARQPGAEHAPLHFISGALFSGDVQTLYERLQLPTWMCHGERGDFTDYRKQSLVAGRANWHITRFPTGALPYFEVTDAFCASYDIFLQRA